MARYDVLIVGTGHGGAQAAIQLRQLGFEGSIAMIGEELDPPYERPPLSKEYLAGEKDFERLLLRPLSFWTERDIALRLASRVVEVDAKSRCVKLAGGESLSYRILIWAAGGKPRQLACAGADLARIHSVRSRADVDALRAELHAVERVAVIGGGYIGLEAAAILARLGKQIVVFEALDRLLARVAGAPISSYFESAHRAEGVDVRTGVAVDCIEGEGGQATAVQLAGGERVSADMIVVGIGIEPAIGPLREAGAAGGNGVEVDAFCRTSLPDVYAIGDCALHRNRFAGGRLVRIESVQNATDQAKTAARSILGGPEPYSALPWFWSNQYELKLQTVGLSTGHDGLVVRGNPSDRSFSVIYLRQGAVVALDCVNATRDYVQGRKLILDAAAPPLEQLADPSVPLKELAAPPEALGSSGGVGSALE